MTARFIRPVLLVSIAFAVAGSTHTVTETDLRAVMPRTIGIKRRAAMPKSAVQATALRHEGDLKWAEWERAESARGRGHDGA